MKHCYLLLLSLLFLGSCEKSNPSFIIKQSPFEVMPVNFPQNVLLEHFADEAQKETVANSERVEQLQIQFANRLIVATYHQNDFLNTPYTNYVSNSLGGALNILQGSANRLAYYDSSVAQQRVWMQNTRWEEITYDALHLPEAPLSIALETGIAPNNKGFVDVYIAYKNPLPNKTRLLVYLVEDNILPKFQEGSTPSFKHQHVVKSVLSDWDGDEINLQVANENGMIVKQRYANFDLKDYNVLNMRAIAFVFKEDVSYAKKQILNVQQVQFNGLHFWDIF
jgi:hypothetical protein